MTGKVSRAFMLDFAYVANYYQWDAATVEDAKAQTRGNREMMNYWKQLAAAHRAGYEQNRGNNWQRLEDWQAGRINHFTDPSLLERVGKAGLQKGKP